MATIALEERIDHTLKKCDQLVDKTKELRSEIQANLDEVQLMLRKLDKAIEWLNQ